ncbi:MAG: hypothetical protein HWD84_07255 [Flavobacteriaceae bacterium]|jgi:hypothetical protein|nr:hypothetical protein [Flavobacteriaceae bacterium]NVJ72798.1 hypothetical protein [Flavobacteriaceae bacterium]
MNEIPKNNPFKIPENYLEDFKVSLGEKKARSGFSAPDNYFDSFKVRLPEKESKPKVIRLISSYKITAIAAAITILIAVPILINSNQSTAIDFEQLSFNEVDSYLRSTQTSFDNYYLASDLPQGTTELDFLASNQSAIEDYIDLQIEEYSELNLYGNDY